jgi:Protein of unknown function (DUF3604)
VRGSHSPRFGVLAFRDPGTASAPGAPLQRVQIVKGWVDATGQSQEKVFDVAGDPNNGATVDTTTCTPSGTGSDSLCAVWSDPEFDATQRAFYYARVLENPTCRWSTYLCNSAGIDCSDPSSIPSGYDECCNPDVAKTIQERAWSSPIWYRPEGVARIHGAMRFRDQSQQGGLTLTMNLGAMPVGLDPTTQALTIALRDDDDIFNVTIPAGTLRQIRPGHFVLNDTTGSLGGIRSLRLGPSGPNRTILRLRTIPINLAAADQVDHFIEVSLTGGTAAVVATPLWHFDGKALLTD